MAKAEINARLRREQDILDRIENVKRLIQMKSTLMTAKGCELYHRYCMVDREGKRIGGISDNLLDDLRDEIQLQLLSIVALDYGANPDIGEPMPVLEWNRSAKTEQHPADEFRDTFEKCLIWNA